MLDSRSLDVAPARERSSSRLSEYPAPVRTYLEGVIALAESTGGQCVSVMLYGSAAIGGYAERTSDIDLLLVLADDAPADARPRLERALADLEVRLGVGWRAARVRSRLRRTVDGQLKVFVSNFVCPRRAFLAGDPCGIFGVSARKGALTSRLVFANILASAVTVWGEDLRPLVRAPGVTRVDVLKAFWGVWGILVFALVALPWTRHATRYAMAALKKSVHNCYFCYRRPATSLAHKVDFFRERDRLLAGLGALLDLRRDYRSSPRFALSCVWMLPYLHYRAARDNPFPIPVRALE